MSKARRLAWLLTAVTTGALAVGWLSAAPTVRGAADPSRSKGSLTLAITGDVTLHRIRAPRGGRQLPLAHNPYRFVAPQLRAADLAVTNFEGVFMQRNPRYAIPSLNLWSRPLMATSFRPVGIDLVTLANNHILDGRHQGVLETLRHLRAQPGLQIVGAGKTDALARRAYIHRRGKSCVAFVPATTVLNKRERAAARIAYYPFARRAELLAEIRKVRQRCPYVVVLMHFGRSGIHYPELSKKRFARQLIDAGASLVAGGQPHVLQGVEFYRGGVIAYSLGNFIFPNALWAQRRGGLLWVELATRPKITLRHLELIPILIERDSWVPKPVKTPRAQRQALDRMRAYCRPFATRVSLVGGRLRFAPPAGKPRR